MSDRIPDFPPINITPDEARRINESVDARLGKLDDAEIDSLAADLEEAGQKQTENRDFVREVVRIVLSAFLPK